jgi:nuclear pore complex protein Nup188
MQCILFLDAVYKSFFFSFFSEGKELNTLILSDLYYHLQGEFEGRKICPGPFKELYQYLVELKLLQTYQLKYEDDFFLTSKPVYLFDLARLRADMGLDMWDFSEWKASKAIAETMLCCMQEANSMVLLGSSKQSALKALITVLTVNEDDVSYQNSNSLSVEVPKLEIHDR